MNNIELRWGDSDDRKCLKTPTSPRPGDNRTTKNELYYTRKEGETNQEYLTRLLKSFRV